MTHFTFEQLQQNTETGKKEKYKQTPKNLLHREEKNKSKQCLNN